MIKNKLINKVIRKEATIEDDSIRIKRALHMISSINQTLIHVTDEKTLLDETCRIVVEIGGYSLAWVGFVEHDKMRTIRPIAQMGFENGYIEKAKLTWANTKRGRGPGGVTVRTGKPHIFDIEIDPEMDPWKKDALKRGYKSVIGLPLVDKKNVFGVILIYSNKVNSFSSEELKILNELAGDLSFGIIGQRNNNEMFKLKKAVETSSEVIYTTDYKGIITFVNSKFTNLYGYTFNEVVGKFSPNILRGELQKPNDYKKFWNKLYKGKIVKDEHTNKTKDGHILTVESSVNPIFDDKNNITGFLAIQHDITKQKQLEVTLEESEEKYRELVENSPDAIVVYVEGKIIFVNKECLHLLRIKKEEIIGKSVLQFVHPDSLAVVIKRMKKSKKDRVALGVMEEKFLRPDGFFIEADVKSMPIKFKNKEAVQVIIRDITERKNTEKKVKESEEKFRMLFESSKDSILLLDANTGEITDSNPFVQDLLGYSVKELIGLKIFEISPFKDIIVNKEKFLELQNKGYVYYDNLPIKTKSGMIKQVEFVLNIYYVGNKKVIQCNIRDITERIKKERELEVAKGDFLSMSSHQLRTPLSATKWVLESLVKDDNFNFKQREKIIYLVDSNQRLIDLVNDLLDVTRIESGKLMVNKKPTNIKKLINDLSLSLKVLADNKKKSIKIVIPSKLKDIYCDPILIHEALQNLLNNAFIYSKENSKEIIISVHERKNDYLVSVHNDGFIDTISANKISIFDKFTRGIGAAKVEPSGSGLGLYITKRVIEASGGTVWFKSNIKYGTTFYLTITKNKLKK